MDVDGTPLDNRRYAQYHAERLDYTMRLLKAAGSRRVIEVGAHPWALTGRIIDDPELQVAATVSAEEVSLWPDDIGVTERPVRIVTDRGNAAEFVNYSANVERTRFTVRAEADTVLACEIIEHLVRAPHVMLLNVNAWLPVGGRLVLTTPNGAQFVNPLRRRPRMPAYRAHAYERHAYVYSLRGLADLVGKCGFAILRSGFCSPYARSGASRLYGLMGAVPLPWFEEKFSRSLYMVAEKRESLEALRATPQVYEPSPDWENIREGAGAG